MLSARPQPANSPRAGFSLLEVLIAITIVVILGSVVGINLLGLPQKQKVNAARLQIENFKTAISLYEQDNGFIPTAQQGLLALVVPPTVAPVPQHFNPSGYLDKLELPKDPWGNEYAYLVPGPAGKPFDIVCYGSDGEEGGEGHAADLSAW